MKQLLAISLFAFISSVSAGDYYYGNRVDTYDPITGLYYKAVLNKEDRGFMSKGGPVVTNIAITTPLTDSTVLLFKEPLQGYITSLVFETGFKNGSMGFYGVGQPYIQNNAGVADRDPKNKLLIAVFNGEKKVTTLFISEKDGSNLKKLTVVPEKGDWHIDVKNSKLRVVHQLGNTIKIDSVDW